jgi:hypothetical protein
MRVALLIFFFFAGSAINSARNALTSSESLVNAAVTWSQTIKFRSWTVCCPTPAPDWPVIPAANRRALLQFSMLSILLLCTILPAWSVRMAILTLLQPGSHDPPPVPDILRDVINIPLPMNIIIIITYSVFTESFSVLLKKIRMWKKHIL